MGRGSLAVLAGFLAMSGAAFISFTVAFFLMSDRVRPPPLEPSQSWAAVSALLGLLAALIGGVVCGGLSSGWVPSWVLAGLAVVIGFVYASACLAWGEPGPRALDQGTLESQLGLRSPTWLLCANPILDVVGIILGARWMRRGRKSPVA